MDRSKPHRHLKANQQLNRRATSLDGFIPNRRGRLIQPNFHKLPDTGGLQTDDKIIGDMPKIMKAGAKLPAGAAPQQSLGVTWASSRLKDPGAVDLTRPPRKGRARRKLGSKVPTGFPWKKVLKRGGIGLASVLIVVGGYVGYKFAHNIDKVFGGNIFSDLSGLFGKTTLKGEAEGRVNVLLAGDSSDQQGHGGANLTDSILILSIDTNNHTAFLLSIPRDLWVDQPGVGWEKINAANDDLGTNIPGYPQNGMGQLENLVSTDLGIPIDYYALSDYGAFQDAVNAVGGVKVDIQSPDPRGLYDPNVKLKLPNGVVSLNGQTALNLARARGDGYGSYGFPDSDFDRTEHQRQIFTAIVQKAQTLGFLDNPIKIGNLFDAFGNNVQTDLSLKDVLALVQLTKGLNLSNIKSYAYCSTLTVGQDGCTTPLLTDYTDPASGQEALIPTAGISNYDQLQYYYQTLSSNNPVVQEAAGVVVLNGGNTVGLAGKYQSQLIGKGVNVTSVGDAAQPYSQTVIMDNSEGKKPATLHLLESIFGGSTISNNASINTSNASFVVILGANQGPPASSQ
ncbi:MAG TPA: LCP family protein [Candidatus Saccharimonadales bacterium]|nr:LCP family protein [Candidatus Saccharimonadales bacterium]